MGIQARTILVLTPLLLGALAVGCTAKVDDEEPIPEGAEGRAHADDVLSEAECGCYPNAEISNADCLAALGHGHREIPEYYACLDQVLATHQEFADEFNCFIEADVELARCMQDTVCEDTFACANGVTVFAGYVCDTDDDCGDGSDEANCDGVETETETEFTCGDNTTVPASYRCDGEADCADGSDEPADCPVTCESQFVAASASCEAQQHGDEVYAAVAACGALLSEPDAGGPD